MSALDAAVLGRTGRVISRLGYGSMELRHAGTAVRPELDERAAGRLLNDALDGGINYIDTSPTYGPAEELIGKHLEQRREEFTLATKTGFLLDELPARRHSFARDVVRKGLDESLRRLRTDHVDLVQLPGSPSPSELLASGTLDELQALRSEGKCRFIGISGWLPNLAAQVSWGAFDVFQVPYSALQLENESILSDAAGKDIGIVVRGGVAQGSVLQSNLKHALTSAEERAARQRAIWETAALDELLGADSRSDFLVRFLLANRAISTVIIGTADPRHLRENLAAARRGPLSSDVYLTARRRLDEISDEGQEP